MKYTIKKKNVVASLTGWLFILAFGIPALGIIWGVSIDSTLATGPVIAMLFCMLALALFGVFYVLYAKRPKIVVQGDELHIYQFLKRKKVASIRKINGRYIAEYTEESSEKQVYRALKGVPGRMLIAKLVASTEKWKKEQMAKLTYYANGVEVFSMHTGMENAMRLDCQILDSLEINWGYEFDGNDSMGVVPVIERIQTSGANLRHFTEEAEAEKYLRQTVVVESATKGGTLLGCIGFLLFALDYWKLHLISAEITSPMLYFFGAMTGIMLFLWMIQAATKSSCIKLLKARQELILAADQLYGLGGLGKKENKLKITPDFVFSNAAPGIAPLDEIIWVYIKNSDRVNEVCTGLRNGVVLTIARYKPDSGAQEAAAYNILSEHLADRKILWGYGPQQQAIFNKAVGRKK